MFEFFKRRELRKRFKRKAVIAAFKECLRTNELALALMIWDSYSQMIKEKIEEVIEALVQAFVKSPFYLEVKIYLLTLTMHQLSYVHVDKILTSIEERFGQIEDDGSNQYLLCNLNPIKSACHMLMLLNLFE